MNIIRVVDFETTGLEASSEVIEVGLCDLNLDTLDISPHSAKLYYAEHISPESRSIHHIWKEDVSACPKFDPTELLQQAEADNVVGFVAHNASFEAQWLADSKLPIFCSYKAALRMLEFAPTHKNFGLAYFLMDHDLLQIDRSLMMPAHRAGPDSIVTAHIMRLLFEEGLTIEQLAQWSTEPAKFATCPIGEWRGKPWDEVEEGFLNWMLNKESMSDDLKWNAREELTRRGNVAYA